MRENQNGKNILTFRFYKYLRVTLILILTKPKIQTKVFAKIKVFCVKSIFFKVETIVQIFDYESHDLIIWWSRVPLKLSVMNLKLG